MRTFPLLLTSLLLMACALTAPLAQGTETPAAAPLTPNPSPKGGGESLTPNPSPKGGGEPLTPPPSPIGRGAGGEGESYIVTNPSSGAALYVAVFYPDNWDGQTKLPTLVLVPGGSGNSGSFLKRTPGGSTVEIVNQAGYTAVVFDPDGRGQSGGTENYNGFIHQDGLAEVIRFAATLPGVDPANIGLVTYSYGITMGAGALARHPDLPVKFLIDWEGPANRDDTGGCGGAGRGHLQQVASCTDESFWAEREASTFIGQIRVPYQRVQSQTDHVQPDTAHAILMVNNAVSGGVPWVRLNNEAPNQTYDPANLPAMLPDAVLDRQQDRFIVEYARELFAR